MAEQNAASTGPADAGTRAPKGPALSRADVLIALGHGKALIARIVAAMGALGVVLALVLPPVYQARTVLLPPEESHGLFGRSLGGLDAVAGVAMGLELKTPDELYVALLKSTSIEDGLIRQFDLRRRYRVDTMHAARKALQSRVNITVDKKSGLLSIAVDDKDPAVAADLANAHVAALAKLLDRIAVTEAQQRRAFLEKEVAKSRSALAKAQDAYVRLQAKSGVVSVDADTQLAIRHSAEIRSLLAAKQIELSSLGTYATAENPQVKRIEAEVATLKAQLEKIENGDAASFRGTDAGMATLRSYRDMKYQESVVDVLSRQYELARVDEAKSGPLVQQVDVAAPPERKVKPSRLLILLGCLAAGFALAVTVVIGRAFGRQMIDSAEKSGDLARLKHAWAITCRRTRS
ncbi:GNVR domain-containing protein [Burkholderia oklahomensis]|uniref:Chain length determinant family protein n=1 Tax=Burkholderia oklahomensis TaxID=342113 RepID=A0AAI8BB26_9BURK|nr:GNVR domain-containing protein [Burkholderia oklahomensis]AIO68774.1 chain length determinant family protein [Burkholderia oklahomensis]AOI39995.1 chain-length determining protein [Burkholderia oklahomensis EO147]KUY62157.1 chain-length determining protein [Burkholderia oklahomensis EO147]QPS39643.1 chain-length determining protein [Burkholderia oklahomensis]